MRHLLSVLLLSFILPSPFAHAGCCKGLIRAIESTVTLGQSDRDRKQKEKEHQAQVERERAEAERRRKLDSLQSFEKQEVLLQGNLRDLEEINGFVTPIRALLPGLVEDARSGLSAHREGRGLFDRLSSLWENDGDFADAVYETLTKGSVTRLSGSQDPARVREETRLAAEALREIQAVARANRVSLRELLKKTGSTLDEPRALRLVENLQIVVENLRAADTYTQGRLQSVRAQLEQTRTQIKALRG